MIAWLTKLFTRKVNPMNFTAAKSTLTVGETIQTVASFPASYVSDTPSVGTVDSAGQAAAVADGTFTVTATNLSDATKSETLTFTVADATPLATLVPSTTSTTPVAAETPAPTSTAVTEFEKLEELIETFGIDTIDGVRAAIKFIRSIA